MNKKIVFFGNKDLFNKTFKILPSNVSSLFVKELENIRKIKHELLVYSISENKDIEKLTPEYRSYLNLNKIPIIFVFDKKLYRSFYFKNDLDDYIIKPFYIKDLVSRIEVRLNVKKLQDKLSNLIREQLSILDLSSILTSKYNYQTRLKTVVSKLSDIFNADDISMILLKEEVAEVVTDLHTDPQEFKKIQLDLSKYPEIQEAIDIRKPLYIKDIHDYEKLSPYIDSIKEKNIRSILILPIVYHHEVLGVISIKFKSLRKDTYDHLLKYSRIVTNTTAIALKNAEALEEISKETEIKTSYKVKQQELVKSLQQYSQFISKAAIPMILADIHGNVHFLNSHAENIMEYDKFTILGSSFYTFLKEDEQEEFRQQLQSLTEANSYYEYKTSILLESGYYKELTFNVSMFQRNVYLIQISDHPQIEEKQKQEISELNNHIHFYKNLIDISNEAYIGTDKQGNIILFNAIAEQALGYQKEEVKHLKIWQLYSSLDDAKKVTKELKKNQGRIQNYRTTLITKFNNELPVHLNAFYIYDKNNKDIGSLGIFKLH